MYLRHAYTNHIAPPPRYPNALLAILLAISRVAVTCQAEVLAHTVLLFKYNPPPLDPNTPTPPYTPRLSCQPRHPQSVVDDDNPSRAPGRDLHSQLHAGARKVEGTYPISDKAACSSHCRLLASAGLCSRPG